eukprot:TRINITY_DN48051_c0_g1_i1.p1 TRINITY_DN48051_c0_g1~~TRINITY_DN48051_c0_g1_i1.p1  ORF type:complete len:360 (+),score=63.06 TRINITY_DN48051_c0_g1_i1:92-1081(+)
MAVHSFERLASIRHKACHAVKMEVQRCMLNSIKEAVSRLESTIDTILVEALLNTGEEDEKGALGPSSPAFAIGNQSFGRRRSAPNISNISKPGPDLDFLPNRRRNGTKDSALGCAEDDSRAPSGAGGDTPRSTVSAPVGPSPSFSPALLAVPQPCSTADTVSSPARRGSKNSQQSAGSSVVDCADAAAARLASATAVAARKLAQLDAWDAVEEGGSPEESNEGAGAAGGSLAPHDANASAGRSGDAGAQQQQQRRDASAAEAPTAVAAPASLKQRLPLEAVVPRAPETDPHEDDRRNSFGSVASEVNPDLPSPGVGIRRNLRSRLYKSR